MHRPLHAIATLSALAGLASGCWQNGAQEEPASVFFDPARHLGAQEVLEGRRMHPDAWKLGGEPRPVLFQHPPSRVRLVLSEPESTGDPARARTGCVLRFALGLEEDAWSRSDGVRFRVWNGAGAEGEAVFDELLDPRAIGEPAWQLREVPLPGFTGELVFGTDAGPAGHLDFDHAGWAAAHVECAGPPTAKARARDSKTPGRPHVVLISLDTLRRDHLGLYGYGGSTSPTLDALARESWVFDRAFAVAPFTLPTHASMFTGLYPHEHGAGHAAPFVPLGAQAQTLAEALALAGYRTLGFTAGGIMSRRNGLERGFQEWMERTRAPLETMLPSVYAAIGSQPVQPVFLFLHTYDIHGPYPTPGEAGPAPRARPQAVQVDEEWNRIRRIGYHDYLDLERFDGVAGVVAAYDEGIRRVDRSLAGLFERLRALEMWDRALVIVTSDHGESLYDRRQYIGHSYSLYDEEVRVPLIVKLPSGGPAGRSDELVDQVDLMPTVLSVVGVSHRGPQSGSDVLRRARGEAPARQHVEGEAAHTGARYVRTQRWKLIGAADPPGAATSRLPGAMRERFVFAPQLFDAERDAGETTNLYGTPGADAQGVREMDRTLAHRPRPGQILLERNDLGPDVLEQLRGLGYVE